jgi:hypothetical protein
MKNKWLPYVLVLFAIIIIFSLDRLQTRSTDTESAETTAHELPEAKIKINGIEIPYKSGNFEWVEKGTGPVIDQDEPPILFHDLLPVNVKPFSTMVITFSEEDKNYDLGIYQARDNLETGMIPFAPVINNSYTFNNVPGISTIVIRLAFGGKEYHYTFPMITEKVISYQQQLAEEKGYLAVLELYSPEAQQSNWALENINNHHVHKAQSKQVRSLEEAQRMFPDLNITSLPYYAIFNHQKLLFQVNNRDDFMKLIKVAVP